MVDFPRGQLAARIPCPQTVLKDLDPVFKLVEAQAHLEQGDIFFEGLNGDHRVATRSHVDGEIA